MKKHGKSAHAVPPKTSGDVATLRSTVNPTAQDKAAKVLEEVASNRLQWNAEHRYTFTVDHINMKIILTVNVPNTLGGAIAVPYLVVPSFIRVS